MTPGGFEPPIAWMKARSPRPLDDGAVSIGNALILSATTPKFQLLFPNILSGYNFLYMIYIYHGDNPKDSREAFLKHLDNAKNTNILRLDSKETNPDIINNFLNGTSLFENTKILALSNFFSINKSAQDKIIKIINSNTASDIVIWQDKILKANQLKSFSKSKIELFRLDNKLFACLNAIKPHNLKTFIPLYENVIEQNLYDLFLYLLKSNLRKQLISHSRFDSGSIKKAYLQMIELDYQNKIGELKISKELALQRIIINLIK